MSVNAVSSSTLFQPQLQVPGKRQQDLQSLSSALSSGDLAGAQKAFSAFQQDIQAPAAIADPSTQLDTDMKSLGTALGSGDATAMQKAYAALQQDLASILGSGGSGKAHHHHHHHKSSENDLMNAYQNGSGSSSVASAATTAFSATA